jgi:hypothetical protein
MREGNEEGVNEMPESGATVRRPPFLSVPTWDISDEEIAEWMQAPAMQFIARTAEAIRNGRYDNGREVYPESVTRGEMLRETLDEEMEVLAKRGMVRKSGNSWYAITPGRMEPSLRRAVAVLLARRGDLPPALATELDAWNRVLDTLEAAPVTPVRAGAGNAGAVRK